MKAELVNFAQKKKPVTKAPQVKRAAQVIPYNPDHKRRQLPSRAAQPKVPFGALVESGLIVPGTTVTDARRRWTARVRADATIDAIGQQGSIHKIGAAVQGAPSCNGWTFWHMEDAGRLVPLDALRQQYLAALG